MKKRETGYLGVKIDHHLNWKTHINWVLLYYTNLRFCTSNGN